ncbi:MULTISPECIES: dihydroorotase [unclassified Pseudodesulfovibrio]|uniref:dihydroorotase n=1 Tax=unclassified Pseudodesulfovibrio TaxID=2661612 RepID=UPI000FEC1476|nr:MULTISPECIES: dihydroorotase [unclassified Pseudodesulfovibrio]MCJ2166248.1 dihydroorotase [Pseudodesulfovibrio sp. S3-i]RWU02282.1 dihydroorotase [Pseudodesulfovibrio sp. S3]
MAKADLIVRRAKMDGKDVDVFVSRGKIVEVKKSVRSLDPGDAIVEEAFGLTLMASMTDVHVHLREPGYEYKEDVESGLRAAAWGGFSNIMCMANTKPVNDCDSVTELMLEKARKYWPKGPRLFPIGALTKGLSGKELAPMAELARAGCAAFSNDGVPVKSSKIFRLAVEYASDWDRVVIDHCEDPYLGVAAGVNEGEVSSRLGLPAQPDIAEALQVGRDILLAEYLDLPIHLAHISCKKSVDLIRFAKQRGVKITAETTPHYLTMTEDILEAEGTQYDTNAKVNPPLRTEADRLCMIEALNDGTIDCLATDHAPHALHEKETEFDVAPCGITGLDTALSVTWQLVRDGVLTREAFTRAWTTAPTAIFKLPVNTFKPGDPADFFLFDEDEQWTVSATTLYSKGKNTPLLGSTLKGRVKTHFIAGKKIV